MKSIAMDQSLCQVVVETVAAAEGVDPCDLERSLFDVIDPDALEALFQVTNAGHRRTGTVTFEFCGHTVVVSSDGTVVLDDEPTHFEASV